MHWLQTLDAGLFHWVNPTLSNSLLDVLMTFASGNRFFAPAVLLGAALLIWKCGARGRICVLMLVLVIALGDGVVCNTLKQLIHRPRGPPSCHRGCPRAGRDWAATDSGSMLLLARRQLVRGHDGHPSFTIAGACGACCRLALIVRLLTHLQWHALSRRCAGGRHTRSRLRGVWMVWTLDRLWRWAGERWLPLWWRRLPSLMNPVIVPAFQPGNPPPRSGIGQSTLAAARLHADFRATRREPRVYRQRDHHALGR